MPAVVIQVDEIQAWLPELTPEQAQQLITGTMARAARVAPCILDAGFSHADAAADIIRSAIRRRAEGEPGIVTNRRVGEVQEQVDGRGLPKVVFWDSEIEELRQLCDSTTAGVFPIYSMPDSPLTDKRYRAALNIPNCDAESSVEP